jgi:hypothetical protein
MDRGRRLLSRGAVIAASWVLLVASAMAGDDARTFYYGQVVDINPGSRVITVRGDDGAKWRFKVTASTEFEKDLERPVSATLADVTIGVRVRILAGSATMNPTIRQALRIFVYRDRGP